MSVEIEAAIKTSQQAFINGVWPAIAKAVGGGKIIPVESVAHKKFLDTYSGIDHWHVLDDRCLIRGIASRCQWPRIKRFKAFTIRIGNKDIANTELAKRLEAMEKSRQGWLRPHLFVQAFFAQPKGSFENLLYAGIAKMDDVITVIRDGIEGERDGDGDWYRERTSRQWDQFDNKSFAVVPFATIERLKLEFVLVESKK